MSREYGIEKSIRKYMERGGTSVEYPSNKSEVSVLEESGLLNALDELNTKYYEIKCALNSESGKNKPPDVLNYANPRITHDIRKLLTTLGGTVKTEEKVEGSGVRESIGSHRRKLKDRACYSAGPSTAT
jgi:DNA-binding transcriptional ArsR family regulator